MKSEATPDDPVRAPSSKDNAEMEVIMENLPSKKSANDTEEGFMADQTPEDEELEINDENNGHTLELDSPSSNKSVLVFEAWKQYRQQSINL